ncbi:hypothetical protein V474_00120 [Novosphingobium barchaimii LL02]|uniref:Uncharacterized protein n=1 Tax=Novosphingobium barchaimii LL02 TaxID=1114963 RepID=A0A0J8B241_9SPHN|nr:hypothetical protein V474_00120 [Novosphingobium barchaimii LL02]
MTDREKDAAGTAGIMLAFLFIVSCFLGYGVGADVARNQNMKTGADQAAP